MLNNITTGGENKGQNFVCNCENASPVPHGDENKSGRGSVGVA